MRIRKDVNMESMLRLDTNNYNDEMEYRLSIGDINREDLLDFLADGYLSVKQFIALSSYADYLEGIDDPDFTEAEVDAKLTNHIVNKKED